MTIYAAMRLLHVSSAFGMFVFMGVELGAAWLLRRAATPADVRRAVGVVQGNSRFGPLVLFGVLIPGLFLGYRWGYPWWTRIALVSFVAMGALGGAVTGRRVRKLLGTIGDGAAPLTDAEAALVRDPMLRWSLCLQVALVCGIALLMLIEPGALGALSIVAGLLAIGALVARRRPSAISPPLSTDRPSSVVSQARAR